MFWINNEKVSKIFIQFLKLLFSYLIHYLYNVYLLVFYVPDKSSKDRFHWEHQLHVFTSNRASVERFYDADSNPWCYEKSSYILGVVLKITFKIIINHKQQKTKGKLSPKQSSHLPMYCPSKGAATPDMGHLKLYRRRRE